MEEQSSRILINLIKDLQSLCMTNMEYFQSGTQSHHAKFHVAFCLLFEYLDLGIEPSVMALIPRLSEYDVSPQTKGNGYRSLLRVVQKCCLHLIQLSRHIIINRDSMLFRRAHYSKELEAYVATMGQLRACLYYAQQVMNYCQEGMLFTDEDALDSSIADKLMLEFEMLNQDCFYGRCLGFQFCETMQRPLQMVAVAMASFSEGYQENSQLMKLATSVFNSGKYFLNPELRGKQVVNVTRSADVKFCKAFWSITESDIMHQLPALVYPSVEVDEVLQLGPDSFEVKLEDGSDTVFITPPCAHTGPGPVQVRLISYHLRDGQQVHIKSTKSKPPKHPVVPKPKSPGLIVHCHGGGFVAQSSKSHSVYLRNWARDINVPILSIDYSLAPEFPFPRALEECFYAYSWATQNVSKLGSTGKTIILAGDSAGGNLIISTAMRAASFGIRRPDGIMAIYAAVLARYTPSPSRLLALMDPLLPIGILSRCLAAYAGVSDELLNGLTEAEFSSKAPYHLDEDDSSDTEWVIVYDKNKTDKKKKSEETKQTDGIASDSSTEDFHSACQTPQADPSFVDAFDVVSMTTGEKDQSATPTPENCKIVSNEIDAEKTEKLKQSRNTEVPSSLELPPPESILPPLMEHEEVIATVIDNLTSQANCDQSNCDEHMSELSTPDKFGAPAHLELSTPGESGAPAQVDLSTPEKSVAPAQVELSPSDELISIDLNHVSNANNYVIDPVRSESCPDFKQVQKNVETLQNSAASHSNDTSPTHVTRPKNFKLPHSQSIPAFPSNRPRPGAMSPTDFLRHRHLAQSPLKVVRHLPIVKNPYMSPLLAPNELLMGLPDMSLVACHLDPLLDDSIMFTKRLRKLGKKVDLDLVDNLPHGFLNFSLVSKEAKHATDMIIKKLKEMFKMEDLEPPISQMNRPV
ncbi:hypothetical protein SNE40_017204 [Patella caerulea]